MPALRFNQTFQAVISLCVVWTGRQRRRSELQRQWRRRLVWLPVLGRQAQALSQEKDRLAVAVSVAK